MVAFTRDQLRTFAPVAKAEILDALVAGAAEIAQAQITTPLRLQHFLAQVATETGGLKSIEENLSYRAERLVQVWPSRFKTVAAAKPFAMNPKKLAAKVYGGRMGNKTDADAWNYRGSGMLQTTGLTNFTAAGYAQNPEALRTPGPALTSALKYWTDHDCNSFADRDDIVGLRQRINGGTHGLPEAKAYLAKAKKIFTSLPGGVAAGPDLSPARIKALQTQLVSLGYVSIGRPDGVIGPKTIGAISAFQAESGLMVNGLFDEATQEHLYEAEPKLADRVSERPEDSRILKHAGVLKKGALGLLGTGAISSAEDPLSQFEALKGVYDRAKAVLSPLEFAQTWLFDHWFLVLIGVGAAVYFYGRKIEHARLEDHALGKSA